MPLWHAYLFGLWAGWGVCLFTIAAFTLIEPTKRR